MLQEIFTKTRNKSEVVKEILVFVLNLLISTFILRLVWNRSLSKHIDILKPIKSLLDAFILSLSIQVVRGI
jgi:hypothetical protein|tara:strand:- start:3420 stop:3632 length:213 start_codon:yes stop_codon:yes gene_type:complete